MARRKKTIREIAEEVLEQEKQKQGVTPMYGYPYFNPMMPPPVFTGAPSNIDPLSLHKEIVKILEDQEKKNKEAADKNKSKNEPKWPFNLKFTFLQTFMFCMVAGLPLGALQLALLSTLKNALLRTFQ